jgi:hypothetical protein
MTVDEVRRIIRQVAMRLVALEHALPAVRHRIHGATLVLGQVLVTSRGMVEREALAACARSAEVAAESLLLHNVPLAVGPGRATLELAGSDLLALAHQQVIDEMRASPAFLEGRGAGRVLSQTRVPPRVR